MVELKEKVLELLDYREKKMTIDQMAKTLEVNPEEIVPVINELECEGKVFRNKKNEFLMWNNGLGRIYGTIDITASGLGILKEESGQITFVKRDFLNGSLSGDKVIVKDLKMVRDKQEGKVEKVLMRSRNRVLCEVISLDGKKELKPINDNPNLRIIVPNNGHNYLEGERYLVEVGLEKNKDKYLGKIIKRVCHKDDPNADIITIAAIHGFSVDFPEEVKEEVKSIPRDISEEDLSNRVDLRDKIIFTIDGEDTKDIDDAISLEILPNGHYKLGVHIADVSHYVKEGTALYEEALRRGTSVYMLDSVIPMLPRELSNGICSLNPNEDRLAKTCEIEIDAKGNVVGSRIFDSVIRSRKKMSYSAVNKILNGEEIPEGYESYADILKEMDYLSVTLESKKEIRGAVEFERPEIKIKTDDHGKLTEIKVNERGPGEMLIENFMLMANEQVANKFSRLPFIYRVHETPDSNKLLKIIDSICRVNQTIMKPQGSVTLSKNIQKFLASMRDLQEYPAFSNMVLRGMNKARYSEDNMGHFGLALRNYTHFTSPIRRFPDLLVHQLIGHYQKKDYSSKELEALEDRIEKIAISTSVSEREAQKAEFDANDMKIAEYMQDHIGEEYEGTVININQRGMRILLDNLVEGLVHISDIEPKTFYDYDHRHCALVSPDNEFHLGDRILARVKNADRDRKRVDFVALGHAKRQKPEKVKTKQFSSGQNKNFGV